MNTMKSPSFQFVRSWQLTRVYSSVRNSSVPIHGRRNQTKISDPLLEQNKFNPLPEHLVCHQAFLCGFLIIREAAS